MLRQSSTKSNPQPKGDQIKADEKPFCHNILHAMVNGRWQKKPKLTQEDMKARISQDIMLQKHLGHPDKLNRSDFRCGTKHSIPAPAFGPNIPSMCNRDSADRYCCNAEGWCSHGSSNCSCSECTDFRKMVSAELQEWMPLNCQIRNYSSEEACAMVSDRLTSLVLIGDSLMRHFFEALMLVFTNDYQEGALLEKHKERKYNCRGERQFIDGGKAVCDDFIARSSKLKADKFCNGTTKFSFVLNGSYSLAYRKQAIAIVKENLNNRSLFLVGIGLHNGLNAETIMAQLVEPILKLTAGKKWLRVAWMTVHAQGFLKPVSYRGTHSDHKIPAFNQLMTKTLSEKGIDVFDVFPMTRGVYSYDGTHYGYAMAEESGQLPPTSASSSQATSISPEIVAAIQLAVDRSMAANLQSTGSLPQPSVPGAVTAMMVPTVEALSTAGGAGVSSQAGAIGGRCSLVVPSFMNTFSSPVVSALPSTTALTSAIATGSMGPPIPAAIAGSPIGINILPTLYQPFVVGPGYSPVPARLVAQIVSGKFVDLSDLLPSNLTPVTESEPQLLLDGRLVLTSQPKKHKRRLEDVPFFSCPQLPMLHRSNTIALLGNYKVIRIKVVSAKRNKKSAEDQPAVIDEYLANEVALGRVAGPFSHPPIPSLHISSFGVIPKSGQPGKWRLIVDLSSPEGASVNDGIDPDSFSLQYIRVDDIIKMVSKLGKGALLAKWDVLTAYRNVAIHPTDRALLGMRWRGKFYVDLALPFGLRSAPFIFDSIATMVEWILVNNYQVSDLVHYLDDFITTGPADTDVCARNLSIALQLKSFGQAELFSGV
ncbi:hypothetical protein QZH41_003183 [Actinostola sp. cb2023]|nr:hypothetical protein QZH41_003183 [Actinostola sp. cb2023]